eukprot:TRINITY_DN6546_c0_g2_i2.p1 TRINITY_DN6546_c0_g2~~TRINITY_DN6546_c0_g2_i2.p1  ORF type:complete len:361 (+),score=34.08 TRINITY_DN6546_c0_g2_i2:52-1083(+)
MDSSLTNFIISLASLLVATPIISYGLWRVFGESFMSGLAPVEFNSSKGQFAVGITCVAVTIEYCCCFTLVAIPGFFADTPEVGSFADVLKNLPDAFAIGWGLLRSLSAPSIWCCVKWSLYSAITCLFAISYIKSVDTRSDALFTIDRQKGETICSMCSRLVRHHTQHCPYCWRCTDKFDHHSFWVNNCVAERNSKYYTLALIYNQLRAAGTLLMIIPLLYSEIMEIIPFVVCLWALVSFCVIGFMAVVWVISVSYGFNNICVPRSPTQTSSLEILDSVLQLMTCPPLSWSSWKKQLDLPNIPFSKILEHWKLLLGHKGWRWYPSSPAAFPEHGNHAFIFKKSL